MDKNLELFEAASNGDLQGVKSALEKGADVNYANGDGRTSLMRASKRGYEEIVKLLIDNGADVRLRDNKNKTPLMEE